MVTSPAILGTVETKMLKLGAGRIYLGTSPTATFDGTAKFPTNAPGPDWEDLRCLGQNVTLNANTSMFAYKNAVPSVTKKKFVIGRDVTLSADFEEFKSRMVQAALGILAPVNKLAATEYVVQAAPGPTSQIFTLDSVAGLNLGDELVIASATGGLASTQNAGLIGAINTLAITLREPAQTAPVAGWKVKKRISSKLIIGGSDVLVYPLIFVVDFVQDKKQFVAFFPNVSSAGSFSPNLGGGQSNTTVAVAWDCYGAYDAAIADNVLASMYMFEGED